MRANLGAAAAARRSSQQLLERSRLHRCASCSVRAAKRFPPLLKIRLDLDEPERAAHTGGRRGEVAASTLGITQYIIHGVQPESRSRLLAVGVAAAQEGRGRHAPCLSTGRCFDVHLAATPQNERGGVLLRAAPARSCSATREFLLMCGPKTQTAPTCACTVFWWVLLLGPHIKHIKHTGHFTSVRRLHQAFFAPMSPPSADVAG